MIVEARDDTVRLYGILSENQWLTIKAVANLLLQNHPNGIIIDCSDLEDVNEKGAETFLDAVHYIEAADARIVVANLPDPVLETLRAVPGLRSRLPIAVSVEEARQSLLIGGRTDVSAATRGMGILVPLLYAETAEHATTTACRLGRDAKSDVHLAFLLTVPRTMPLNTPMPDDEVRSERLLSACEAIVKRFGLRPYRHTVRTRDRGEEVLHLAETLKIQTLVLSRLPDPDGSLDDASETILRRAKCEVIIDQMPLSGPEAG